MINTENQNIVWKPYPECPLIEANQFGDIRIKDRYVKTKKGLRFVKGRVLKQILQRNGYTKVRFSVNNKKFYLFTHRIVASAFIPNPDNLPEVDHIDCDRTNNAVSNLRWVTHEENIAHCVELGHFVNNLPETKTPIIAINLENLKVFYFESQHEAERQLGFFHENINAVLKGRQKKTHGYWFVYANENAVEKTRTRFGDEVAGEVEKLMKTKVIS